MISKKVLGMMAGAILVFVVGCTQQVAPITAPANVPVETSKTSVVQPVADTSMLTFDGDVYTLSYPSTWKYEVNAEYDNADTFHGSQDDNSPMLVLQKMPEVLDKGMCLKSTKKETITSASGLKFALNYMVPDDSAVECKDAWNYLKNPNFVDVSIGNSLGKLMDFNYAKSDEVASVTQLKAVLDSVKKK